MIKEVDYEERNPWRENHYSEALPLKKQVRITGGPKYFERRFGIELTPLSNDTFQNRHVL